MPYAQKPFQDEEEKKNQQGGVNISGQGGANFSTGIPGQEASAGAKPQKSSGNYANIQSYLDANKQQADEMGQNIAGKVDSAGADASQKIQDFDSKTQKVEAYDPNEIFNNVTNLSDDQKDEYRNQRSTGGYSGPTTIDQVDGYADTQKAAQDAANKVQNAGTETGQQQLLKETYARPKYSAGENRLDQVLLQNSAGSKQALEDVSNKYKGLTDMLNTSNQKVGDSITAAQTQALANKQNLLTAEQSQWDNLLNPIQQRATQANIDNPNLVNRITSDLSDDTLSEETLNRLGLTAGQKLYNMNLSSYLNPNLTQVGIDNVATSDERAKYKALADLIQDPTRTQLTDTGASVDPLGFDLTKFKNDQTAKAAELQKIFENTQINRDFGFDNFGWLINGGAGARVSDYLNSGESAIGTWNNVSGGGNGSGRSASQQAKEDAMNGAKASAIQALEEFLNQQNYYRTIQQG